jgi:hypothetical protein
MTQHPSKYKCICGNDVLPARWDVGYHYCFECGERIAKEERFQKSRRVTLAYNKGPYMYITPGTDTSSLGKKSGTGDGER